MESVDVVCFAVWGMLVFCLPLAWFFNSIPNMQLMLLTGLLAVQAVLAVIPFLPGGVALPLALPPAFLALNIVLLVILFPRIKRRACSSYLWGALSSLWTTSQTSKNDTQGGHPLLRRLFSPLVRRLWIDEVHGLENIPRDGACLVAFNHESYFDFICFTAAIDRKIHFLAAEKFFQHPIWKRVMRAMECIRVDRSCRVNRTALKSISAAIAQDRLVGIFPEGTRSPDGKLMRGKPGIAYLAHLTGVPVIPVGLIGTFEIMSRHDRIPRLRKAIIKIGAPLRFEAAEGAKPTPDGMQLITDQIMLRIAELTGETYPCMEVADV